MPLTRWLAWLLLSSFALPAAALDYSQVRFRTVSIEQGLSHASIQALTQDADGYLWFGTQDGLNRYDGTGFRVLDRQFLGDAHIKALAEDGGDGLWIGTLAGGLMRLDLATYRLDRARDLPSERISGLVRDGPLLWVIMEDAVPIALQLSDGAVGTRAPDDAALRATRHVFRLRDGRVLFATASGIRAWRPGGKRLDPWPSAAPVAAECPAAWQHADGRVFVGCVDGLHIVGADDRPLALHTAANGLPGSDVRSLAASDEHELWVGTVGGLARLDLDSGMWLQWQHDPANPTSIAGNRIEDLLVDRQGVLWLGTWSSGVSLHVPASRALQFFHQRTWQSRSLPASAVRNVHGAPDGTLWLAHSENGGLSHVDPARGVIARYQHAPDDPASLPSNLIRSVLRMSDGSVWAGSNGGGVARLRDDGTFERYRPDAEGDLRQPAWIATTLYETRDGTLWIGSEDAGLLMRCAGCTRFEPVTAGVPDDPAHPLPSDRIMTLAEDAQGRLWIGYFGEGVAILDRASGRVETLRSNPADPASLPGDVIAHINHAPDGTTWIATYGAGLAHVDRHLRTTRYGIGSGLRSDILSAVLFDAAGALWISHSRGVDRFDPATGRATALWLSDGFDRAGYYPGSAWREPDGTLDFGGLNGWLRFRPEALPPRMPPPPPRVTSLRIFNQDVRPHALDPQSPLTLDIARMRELELSYQERMFGFAFSSLDFASPHSTRYRYRLLGLDSRWLELPAGQRFASFSNTPPGRYVLEVQAASGDGEFSSGLQLPVRITPPWWRSPSAYAVYALAGLVLALLLLREHRRRRLAREQAAEAIRRSREQLAMALWGSRDELWDMNLQHHEIEWQNRIEHLHPEMHRLQASYDEYLALLHPDDVAGLAHAWDEHVAGRSEYYEATFRVPHRDGQRWVWLLTRGQAVARDAGGRALRVVGSNRDVTALKEVEQALRESNETLERRVAERTEALQSAHDELIATLEELKRTQRSLVEQEKMASLGGLVAGIAHEINTPIGIAITAASHIDGTVGEITAKIDAGKLTKSGLHEFRMMIEEGMRLIVSSLERAGTLVASFKQVAVDQSSERRRRIDLREFLDEVMTALHPIYRRGPWTVENTCPQEIMLDTYPGALFRILTNLVNNSVLHAFPNDRPGRIEVGASEQGESVVLRYRDDGVGMSADVAARAFDPFFTTRRGSGGSGLGLHLAYNLATQLLGGTIELRTSPGGGVEFVFRLPVSAPQRTEAAAAPV